MDIRHASKYLERVRIPVYFLIVLALLSCVQVLQAHGQADQVGKPFLRLHTWNHTAEITQISVSANAKLLASSSRDKTIRLWDVTSGAPLTTLRPPIGEHHNDGVINSVAISPNSETLAAGGITGKNNRHYVYLFDLSRKNMGNIFKILEVPDSIRFLTYSPRGRFLVVLMGSGAGLRIYDTKQWTVVTEDKEYGGKSFGAAFSFGKDSDEQERLATSCMDGFVRLYEYDNNDNKFVMRIQKSFEKSHEPFGIAFSLGGDIAVGFVDAPVVHVLDGNDLSVKYTPDTSNVPDGNFSSVAWSANGDRLYAGGRFALENYQHAIRVWDNSEKGTPRDIPVARDTITDIRTMSDGGIAFSSRDPRVGFLDSSGRTRFVQDKEGSNCQARGDYRDIGERLLLSPMGDTVQFPYGINGEFPLVFSVTKRILAPAPKDSIMDMYPALTVVDGHPALKGVDAEHPVMGEIKIRLEPDEAARSVAIDPNDRSFILGADWNLYAFDKTGTQRWKTSTQSAVWGVNISLDGRLVVAAIGDGTIRWFSMDNGSELLSLFPSPDLKRWILWTRSGYYDLYPGADGQVGWHVNRGFDKAGDFYELSQYEQTYLRPDIISHILETRDELGALRLVAGDAAQVATFPPTTQGLTPQIRMLSSERGVAITPVGIRVAIRTQSPVEEFKIRVNDSLVPPAHFSHQKTQEVSRDSEEVWTLTVPIPPEDGVVVVQARNHGGWSSPTQVSYTWTAKKVKPQRNLNVLAVGVSTYEHIEGLAWAHKDAADLVEVLKSQEGLLYDRVNSVPPLTNDRATKKNIVREIESWRNTATRNDVSVLLLSGHGAVDHGVFYFLPFDIDFRDWSNTALGSGEILQLVGSIEGHVIIFIDACRGELPGQTKKELTSALDAWVNSLIKQQNAGAWVFTAATGDQLSKENPENGEFTRAVVEGLTGAAAFMGNKITTASLETYVDGAVKTRTSCRQIPGAYRMQHGMQYGSNLVIAQRAPMNAASAVSSSTEIPDCTPF